MRGYFKISRHYKFALEKLFMEYQFQAMFNVMLLDSTIFCVSAWNDNGIKNLIESYRTGINFYIFSSFCNNFLNNF